MNEIIEYSNNLDINLRSICEVLYELINRNLLGTTCKLYHGSPVWFLNDNPIVGYSKKANNISLLFWSGQSFTEVGLSLVGKYKAAEIIYSNTEEVDKMKLEKWLMESQKTIWNYKDIRKSNGVLALI